MKVIKKGRKQKGWSKKFTCSGDGNGGGGCGAVLLVEENDVYMTSSSHYDGSTDYYYTFQCCECLVETDINQKHLSGRVMDKAKNGKRRPFGEP